ncbi:MAG: hypothetical protein KIS92_26810 [Planctomycetota bacterium]|nr:hypothetical protein [Planctomycetota bacterium]
MDWFFGFLKGIPPVRWLLDLPWARVLDLAIGEQLGLAVLAACVFVGTLAALDRMTSDPDGAPAKPEKKPKKGLRLRHLALVLVALLPGGLVGSAAVVLAMGKAHWRRDAVSIVGLSYTVGALLLWYDSRYFPLPQVADNFHASGVLGIAFGLLTLWATIKLLRELWGEPIAKVPWHPPLALWLQGLQLGAALFLLLH